MTHAFITLFMREFWGWRRETAARPEAAPKKLKEVLEEAKRRRA